MFLTSRVFTPSISRRSIVQSLSMCAVSFWPCASTGASLTRASRRLPIGRIGASFVETSGSRWDRPVPPNKGGDFVMARLRQVLASAALAAVTLLIVGATAAAAAPPQGSPGAPGVGDPYFPLHGNGGYDVQNYELDLSYNPPTDRLDGTAPIPLQ